MDDEQLAEWATNGCDAAEISAADVHQLMSDHDLADAVFAGKEEAFAAGYRAGEADRLIAPENRRNFEWSTTVQHDWISAQEVVGPVMLKLSHTTRSFTVHAMLWHDMPLTIADMHGEGMDVKVPTLWPPASDAQAQAMWKRRAG